MMDDTWMWVGGIGELGNWGIGDWGFGDWGIGGMEEWRIKGLVD